MIVALTALAAWATAPPPVWTVDLTATDGGFVSGGQTAQWAWGEPTVAGPVGSGACWGTVLDGQYLHDTVDWLELTVPNLTGISVPSLVIRHWYQIRNGDTGVLEVDDLSGGGFVRVDPIGGYPTAAGFAGVSGGWLDATFDLRGFGLTPRVRLSFTADAAQADAGWYLQQVTLYDGDVLPPVITPVVRPSDTQDLDGPYPVEVDVTDEGTVQSATLWVQIDGGTAVSTPMSALGGGHWSAGVPGEPADTMVDWWVEATDGVNVGRWPDVGSETFRVYLAAPENVHGPDAAHFVGNTVPIGWDPPVSPHSVEAYEIYREGLTDPVATAPGSFTDANVPAGLPARFWVVAVYDVGPGDPSATVDLSIEVPTATLTPDQAFQGDHLYVTLGGASLYLLAGQSALDLGPGVDVLSLDVRDAHAGVAELAIDAAAAVGPRDVTVTGTAGTFVFPSAFSIGSGADAPQLVAITPSVVRQGDQVVVEVEASTPFAGPPEITVDDDFVLTTDVVADGTAASFGLAVIGDARLGPHSIAVDDGGRLYTIVLEVEERTLVLPQGCVGCDDVGTSTTGPAWTLLLGAGWLRRRRSARR